MEHWPAPDHRQKGPLKMALTTVQDEHPAHTFDEPPMLIERHAAYFEAIGTARQLTQAAICVPTQIPQGRRRTAFERLPDGRFMTMRKQPGNPCSTAHT